MVPANAGVAARSPSSWAVTETVVVPAVKPVRVTELADVEENPTTPEGLADQL